MAVFFVKFKDNCQIHPFVKCCYSIYFILYVFFITFSMVIVASFGPGLGMVTLNPVRLGMETLNIINSEEKN